MPATPLGIRGPYEAPSEVFLLRELTSGAAMKYQGIVHYHAAFDALG